MEITVTVNAPELAGAITKLALAIEGAALNKNGEVTIRRHYSHSTERRAGCTAYHGGSTTADSSSSSATGTDNSDAAAYRLSTTAAGTYPGTADNRTAQQKALTLNDIATAGAGL